MVPAQPVPTYPAPSEPASPHPQTLSPALQLSQSPTFPPLKAAAPPSLAFPAFPGGPPTLSFQPGAAQPAAPPQAATNASATSVADSPGSLPPAPPSEFLAEQEDPKSESCYTYETVEEDVQALDLSGL